MREIVHMLPLDELRSASSWPRPDHRIRPGEPLRRERRLDHEGVRAVLRELGRASTLVVADVGEPLRWLTGDDAFAFWRSEASPRIGSPNDRNYLEDFPGE